jgi:hypothetical protein
MLIPIINALYMVYGNLKIIRKDTANQMAIDAATWFTIAQNIADRRVAKTLVDTWETFGKSGIGNIEWSRIFSALTSAESLYHDILLVNANGHVIASGKMDSPTNAAPLLNSIGGIPSGIYRGEAYNEDSNSEYMLPYVAGVSKDQSGAPHCALVFLVNTNMYQKTSNIANIAENLELCMTDRAGRVIFRYPNVPEIGGRGVGERIPYETWQTIKGGPNRSSLPSSEFNKTLYYSAYSKFIDENGDAYGAVLISISDKAMPSMTSISIESGAAIALIALISVFAAFAVGLKFTLFRSEGQKSADAAVQNDQVSGGDGNDVAAGHPGSDV